MTTASRSGLDHDNVLSFVRGVWEDSIVPQLVEYIRIPNKSPHFDANWAEHGHMERAVELIADWCRARPIEGLSLEVVQLEGRTPLIYMEVAGTCEGTVVLYGHLDKQPEMAGWDEGLGPWEPVLRGERLYGRGGADDGYSAFASLTAIEALQKQGVPHARCVVLIEACEESGSYDLPAYVDALAGRIGEPDLVICLDSGCGDYDRMWLTTSLRGNLTATLKVDTLREGVHSGDASGVVPSSFRILRVLLDRLEDANTGEVRLPELHADIPEGRVREARLAADVLGDAVFDKFPFVAGAGPITGDRVELVLNRTWRPAIATTGAAGLPAIEDAGNVLRPTTSLKLSLRLPPTCDPETAKLALERALTADEPYGAAVTLDDADGAQGWNAPPLAEWLERSVDEASQAFFGAGVVQMGEGGTIPFMGMLGEKFPGAQFLITGVLGPGSNAHGPNEFLHVPTGVRVTACVSRVLADHGRGRIRAPVRG
ncbi:MAG: M20/M25/M40 family metallo-hydrolase [bacterium]|nr:M20/M25/M40 family metallo-hydrolase [bacterium]